MRDFGRTHTRAWADRLYRPFCWHPEPAPGPDRAGYKIPDPLRSYEEGQHWHHGDLAGMDRFALWREGYRVEAALAQSAEPDEWLKGRLAAVAAEKRRRRR